MTAPLDKEPLARRDHPAVTSPAKRGLDIVLSLLLSLVIAPVLVLVSIGVLLTMGTPVLFWQERPGLRGRPFWLVKFRTMATGIAPDGERLTRLGHLLRRTSLDELPELYNIIRGEMSFVGPRPLLVEYLSLYTERQRTRHAVRPGLTGWAQVHGRNATDWEQRLEQDVWYVENWSLPLDARIIASTFGLVLRRSGVSHPTSTTMPRFTGSAPHGSRSTVRED
jgi:sugar transferase EpsL